MLALFHIRPIKNVFALFLQIFICFAHGII
jgi:hypothetical protein